MCLFLPFSLLKGMTTSTTWTTCRKVYSDGGGDLRFAQIKIAMHKVDNSTATTSIVPIESKWKCSYEQHTILVSIVHDDSIQQVYSMLCVHPHWHTHTQSREQSTEITSTIDTNCWPSVTMRKHKKCMRACTLHCRNACNELHTNVSFAPFTLKRLGAKCRRNWRMTCCVSTAIKFKHTHTHIDKDIVLLLRSYTFDSIRCLISNQ